MNEEELENILKTNDLRKTKARLYILGIIKTSEWALSHKEIEENAPKSIDRVTIYRTLNSFEKKGMIHKILDIDGISHFAMCKHTCSTEKHIDNHVHFHCVSCKKIYCLEEYDLRSIKIPTNFIPLNTYVKIDGNCNTCR